jgi:hypothetical protein
MIALFGMLLWCACKDRPRFEPEKVVRKPVVTVAPVPTRPYEDGYRAGFDSGKQQAAPHAKMPDPETLQRLAREQASGQPDRTERWERGFADGYADGFRNVVTGQK